MKAYTKAKVELINFDATDVISASTTINEALLSTSPAPTTMVTTAYYTTTASGTTAA